MTSAEIEALVARFVARTLPKAEWTHEAHLVVGSWHAARFPREEALALLRERIRGYNTAVGTANTDAGGYHETLTVFFLDGIRGVLAGLPGEPLAVQVAAVLASPLADRAAPLARYRRETLFSVAARRGFVPPDAG